MQNNNCIAINYNYKHISIVSYITMGLRGDIVSNYIRNMHPITQFSGLLHKLCSSQIIPPCKYSTKSTYNSYMPNDMYHVLLILLARDVNLPGI